MKVIDITNKRFNYLTAIKFSHRIKNHSYWIFRCDCGREIVIEKSRVVGGRNKSCGCKKNELCKLAKLTHGDSRFSEYRNLFFVWCGIKQRCFYKNHICYKNYGGRGITMCDEWLNDYSIFKKWSLNNNYKYGLKIDRINNNGNYEPNNCRWVSNKENCRNTRKNKTIFYNNEHHCISEWCEIYNISASLFYNRKKLGWDLDKIFNTKKRNLCKKKNI